MPEARKRVLLFAEAVTLAHVARPLAFAAGLGSDAFEVAVACSPHAAHHVTAAGLPQIALESISPAAFLRALAAGKPLYDVATLTSYVESDLRIIEAFRPDLIVGDFRLSLSISARLAKVPYATIASAYWSPHYQPNRWPIPALPLTRVLPLPIARWVFAAARPLAFVLHCGPLNAVRHRYGLPGLPPDLRRIYTDADHVLYSDVPGLFSLAACPPTHRLLGPVLWEPRVDLPHWWGQLGSDRPVVYVTLGSSGDPTLLPRVLVALADLPVQVVAATAGVSVSNVGHGGALVADYLPGLRAARRAQLVVCNGGSLTTYQALAAGVPALGIAGNLDQFLNMQAIEAVGAGATLRADRWAPARLKSEVIRLLDCAGPHSAARALQAECRAHDFGSGALDFANGTLSRIPTAEECRENLHSAGRSR